MSQMVNSVRLRGRIIGMNLTKSAGYVHLRVNKENAPGTAKGNRQNRQAAVSNTPTVVVFGDKLDKLSNFKVGSRVSIYGHIQTGESNRFGAVVLDEIFPAANRLDAAFADTQYEADQNVVCLSGKIGKNRNRPNDGMMITSLEVGYYDEQQKARTAYPRIVAYNSLAKVIEGLPEGAEVKVLGFVQTRAVEEKGEAGSERRGGRTGRTRDGQRMRYYESFVATSIERE